MKKSLIVRHHRPGLRRLYLVFGVVVLLMALAAMSATRPVLLVTGEESVAQVKLRAERLGGAGNVQILAETELETVCATLRTERPDVCVIDVRLPDGNGLELAEKLREARADVGIVILTMYAGDDQMFAALDAGASAFVPKSAPRDDVVAVRLSRDGAVIRGGK